MREQAAHPRGRPRGTSSSPHIQEGTRGGTEDPKGSRPEWGRDGKQNISITSTEAMSGLEDKVTRPKSQPCPSVKTAHHVREAPRGHRSPHSPLDPTHRY